MKRSKKGNWIIEDDRYQYLAHIEEAAIIPIKMYQRGFQSITAMVQKYNAKDGKYVDFTWPDYYFKEIAWSSKEEVMKYLLKHYKNKETEAHVTKRLVEYRGHLIENYPEMLV